MKTNKKVIAKKHNVHKLLSASVGVIALEKDY